MSCILCHIYDFFYQYTPRMVVWLYDSKVSPKRDIDTKYSAMANSIYTYSFMVDNMYNKSLMWKVKRTPEGGSFV